MTTALAWPLLIAGLVLPMLLVGIAKASGKRYNNHTPRVWESRLEGMPQRAHAAHLNSFEAFPLFAAAVLFAALRGVPEATILPWAWGFVGLRVLYGVLYVVDQALLRSLVWLAATACAVWILFLGA